MATLQDIQDKVDLAKLYVIQIVHDTVLTLRQGYGSLKDATALKRLIRALSFDIEAGVNDDTTLSLYKCLLKAIGDFGATYTIDPTVKVPGQTIVINYPDSGVDLEYNQTFLIDGGGGNWYLPLVDSLSGPVPVGARPVLLTLNGVSFTPTYDATFNPTRLYGFGSNASATIIVTVIVTGNTPTPPVTPDVFPMIFPFILS